MGVVVGILRGAVAVGLVLVAVRTVIAWRRRRGSGGGYLAASVTLITVASVLRGVADLVDGDAGRVIVEAAMVCFAASGPAFLSYRHALVPVDTRRHLFVTAATAATVAGAVTARTTVSVDSTAALVAALTVVLVWAASVGEPVVSFWRVAEDRSPLQRARLRALAVAYVGIALVAVVSVATDHIDNTSVQLGLHSLSLAIVPVMYAGFVVPGWLRRSWRQPVERATRLALLDVVGAGRSDATGDDLGASAVAWGQRLVGGSAAVLFDASGNVVAGDADEVDLLRPLALEPRPEAALVEDVLGRRAAVAPLGREASAGALVVLVDPLAPEIGDEDVVRLGDLAVALGAVLDRQDTLRTLARQTDRYEKLLQAIADMGVAFLIVDRATDRVVFANDAMTRLTGYTREELMALPTFASLLEPAEVGRVARIIDSTARGDAPGEPVDTVAVRKDGSRVLVEVSGKVTDDALHTVALVRDVSERQRRTMEDRRRVQQLSSLAGAARVLAELSTDMSALAPGIAAAARDVFGCRWASVRVVDESGAPMTTALVGERASWGEELAVPLVRGDVTVGVLYLGPKVDQGGGLGGYDEVDVAAAGALASLAAEAIGVAGAFARETDLVEQLKAVDRMKNTFLNAVSHELRTPLAVILGISETVARAGDEIEPAQRRKLLEAVTRNAAKLDGLLNDLLDLDRLNRGILQPHRRATDLNLLVESVLADTDLRRRRPVTVSVEPLVASLDGPKVERILENLLRNAEKHTPDGTPIWVTVEAVPEGVSLVVEDAGAGVPAELHGSIFEPFERGTESTTATGVGIGLSLVARFAELHGGRAWVTERPGGGASFHVVLQSADVVATEAGVDQVAHGGEGPA